MAKIKNSLIPLNRELDFVNPTMAPVFAQSANSLEKKIQDIFIRMFAEACTMSRQKTYKFSLQEEEQEYREIIEQILIKSGCKEIIVQNIPESGSPWDYIPKYILISFANPNYEAALRTDADYFRKEIQKRPLPDTKRVIIDFDCTGRSEEYDAALIPKLLSLLQQEYQDVDLRRMPGWGAPWNYTPPYLSVSFTNPRYARLLLS